MQSAKELMENVHIPKAALLFFESSGGTCAEVYKIDAKGKMINPHPLTCRDARSIIQQLENLDSEKTAAKKAPLRCKGLLPENVLFFNAAAEGHVLWYTPGQRVMLHFGDKVDIKDGESQVPPLLWRASKHSLYLYALMDDKKPALDTPLYHAPFFNTYENGSVCMGNVSLRFPDNYLEHFIERWQVYFFNSKFTHAVQEESPVTMNLVQLWEQQIKTGKSFPQQVLKPAGITLNNLIV